MKYELAKELKDAGFPLARYGYDPEGAVAGQIVPTLSELIEACGEDFLKLTKDVTGWLAYGEDEPLEPLETVGPTPEEAVARLWLALNKK